MKFGFLLPVEGNVTSSRPDLRLVERLAVEAERSGFASLWVGDRILLTPRLEATTILSYLAAKTSKVKLGTAVLVLPLRNPVLLAHSLASLDIITGGRLVVGAGVGAPRIVKEFDAVNIPFNDRGRMLNEIMVIMKALWSGRTTSGFEGQFFKTNGVSLALRPVQKDGPPIWLAGFNDTSLKRVAKFGEGWLPTEITPQQYAECWHRLSELATKQGRNPGALKKSLYFTTNFGKDSDQAKKEGKLFLDRYYAMDVGPIERFGLFGSETELVKRMEEYSNAGVEEMIVRFASFGVEQTLRSFVNNVLPSF